MRYIIADRKTAEGHGYNADLHNCKETSMCLNEKEVMSSVVLQGTLEERARTLRGVVCEQEEALRFVKNY